MISSVQFSRSVMSDSLQPHEPQHHRPPCPHQLLEFTLTHVHWLGDAIQPSHPLLSPSPPAFNLSQHQGLFWWVSSSHQVAKGLEFQLNPTLKPSNCCCKTHQILPDGDTEFWGAGTHCVSPLAWQSTKVILFYFTQNCLQDSVQHQCTEAEFSASLGGHRQDSHCRMIMSGKEETFLHPSVFFWSI